jgi:hypothetical protein
VQNQYCLACLIVAFRLPSFAKSTYTASRCRRSGETLHPILSATEDPLSIRVVEAEQTHLVAWDRYVDQRPDAGAMHHSAWYNILADASGVHPLFLMAVDQCNRVHGVMPCYCSVSKFSGRHIDTLRGGILADTAVIAEQLLANARSGVSGFRNPQYLLLRGGSAPLTGPDAEVEVVHTVVDTRLSSEKLFARIRKKDRWLLRQALKNKDEMVEMGPEHVTDFYRLYSRHQHDLGTPAPAAEFFHAMFARLGDAAKLFGVLNERTIRGFMICVRNGAGWASEYVALDPAFRGFDVGYILYWKVIEWMANNSPGIFDLGRSTAGSGVHAFKRKWGSTDIIYKYAFYGPHSPSATAAMKNLRTGRTLKQRIWRAFPQSLCNLIGPRLRRQDPFG